MKKNAIPVCLAIAVIGGIWSSLELDPSADTPTPKPRDTSASTRATDGSTPEDPGKDRKAASDTETRAVPGRVLERTRAMNARRPDRNFTAEEVERAMERRDMWSSTEEVATDRIPLEEEDLHDGRQLIQFSPLKLESLQAGDRVAIDITEANTSYEVTIDRIEKHDYDSVSWYGHIDGNDGQRYQVSFTRGESLTVGGIDTPDGNFQLQAHGDAGWIASSGSLFETSGETDAVYPPGTAPGSGQ
ncbi:hypothetical protein [Microbulbifer halophilus]|uniref:Uncharacterized protein n=1 Tax=Microbulbifer halophilus TaxID=453963 RepID=A0ABW5EFI0_9GAMM|nr:hypothetical protein [Microbulbifer halophilus]MCW8126449.1 hypothetical protein [Microbulbifer halophilus]